MWLDTGTPDSLIEAGLYVKLLAERQGVRVSCPEEIAWRSGFITTSQFVQHVVDRAGSEYGDYLEKILTEFVKQGLS